MPSKIESTFQKRVSFFLSFLLFVTLGSRGFSDDKPEKTASTGYSSESFLCSILSKKGGGQELSIDKSDLQLFIDGHHTEITQLTPLKQYPLRFAILVDASSSMKADQSQIAAGLSEWIKSLSLSDRVKGLIVGASTKAILYQDYCNTSDLLLKAIGDIKWGGGSKLYDTMDWTLNERFMKEQGVRKLFILITDGDDNLSAITARQIASLGVAASTSIFILQPAQWGGNYKAIPANGFITEQTGGSLNSDTDLKRLPVYLDQIFEEQNHLYQVEFKTSSRKKSTTPDLQLKARQKGLTLHYPKQLFCQ
jgi:hypothetical protein